HGGGRGDQQPAAAALGRRAAAAWPWHRAGERARPAAAAARRAGPVQRRHGPPQLPCAHRRAGGAGLSRRAPPRHQSRNRRGTKMERVLRTMIVDDESLARSRLRTLLAECRAPAAEVVAEAAHGAVALERLATTRLDLVLLDIHMPGLDGLELARILGRR